MREIRMHGNCSRRWPFWAATAIVVALILCCALFSARFMLPLRGEKVLFGAVGESSNPYVITDGAERILRYEADTYTGLDYNGQPFYMRCTLEDVGPDALLVLYSTYPYRLWLGDELFYDNTPSRSTVDSAGYPLTVTLPSGYAGQTLTVSQSILITDTASEDIEPVFIAPIVLYSREGYLSAQTSPAFGDSAAATALFVLGTALAVLFLVGAYYQRFDAGLLCLALFCFTLMLYNLSSSGIFALYYPNGRHVRESMWYFVGYIGLAFFVASRMRIGRSFFSWCILACIAACTALECIGYWWPAHYELVHQIMEIMLLGLLGAGLGLAFYNASKQIRFFRIFLAVLIPSAIAALILSLTVLSSPTEVGTLPGEEMNFAFEFHWMYYILYVPAVPLAVASLTAAFTEFVSASIRQHEDLVAMTDRMDLAQVSYAAAVQHEEFNARARHDFQKHLFVLAQFLDEGNPAQAQSYIQSLADSLKTTDRIAQTGIYVVDTILNAKTQYARQKGICVALETWKTADSLPLSETELTSVLMNVLDNAIEAAQQTEQPRMKIRAYMKNDCFVFVCENTTAPGTDSQPRAGHGYGLRIIRDLVERHDGLVQCERMDEEFAIRLAIPLNADSSEAT